MGRRFADEIIYGIDTSAAHLSWNVVTPTNPAIRGEVQVAYEVEVQYSDMTPVWASGKTASAAQRLVVPSGILKPDCSYVWHVRLWISTDGSMPAASTAWSCGNSHSPASFDTAPDATAFPATAKWIGGGGQMRLKEGLVLPAGTIARARAWVSGVGAFYFFVNGEKVGVNVMDPPQTVYSKTVLYSTFDVASLLKVGETNDIGAILGNYKWGYTDQVSNHSNTQCV
jgi:alpha-L-rhamnosidase